MVTVLFSVICGNRLMDNHLMRSASSSSSLIDPYKSDTNREDYLGIIPKFKENSKTFPHDLFYDKLQELSPPSSRRCNEKWLDFIKPEDSYVNCANDEDMIDIDKDSMDSNNDVDDALTVPSFKDLKFYGKNKNSRRIFNEVDEGRAAMAPSLSALPIANFDDFYDDLVVNTNKDMATMKRNGNAIGTALGTPPARGCDCRLKVS